MSAFDHSSAIPVLERSLEFFRPHHQELRKRLVKIIITIVGCSLVAYLFKEPIASLCIAPLYAANPLVHKLVYTNLPEAFLAYIKLALLVGLMAALPVVIYQLWAFVSPGLKRGEKKLALTVVFWSTLLFLGGGSFAFFVVLPKMLIYFLSYATEGLEPLPKLGKYLVFVARTVLTFGLAFQIPFLMVMAGKAGITRYQYFQKQRSYFYIAIVILAFLLTAGDIMATILLALPLFLLYEAGIFLTRLFTKDRKTT